MVSSQGQCVCEASLFKCKIVLLFDIVTLQAKIVLLFDIVTLQASSMRPVVCGPMKHLLLACRQ